MRQPESGPSLGSTAADTPVGRAELGAAETLPSSNDAEPARRDRVGRFVVSSLLGQGGMGAVYAATDPELDRVVAIKLLRPGRSARFDARLRREARVMARLSHPNLVTVHEVGVHDGQVFIAMELIAGHTSRAWARGKPWRDIVKVYAAAGRGLAAAHDAGIVHRDFKPDNVLVGDDGRVAVGDFGLAQTDEPASEPDGADAPGAAPSPAPSDDKLTHAGALVGTPRYMAPEQLAREPADARSDQFAFCVSLWEALDAHPFGAHGSIEPKGLRAAIAAGATRPRPPGVPREVMRALARGLSVDPAARWPDMHALLRRLDAAVARRAKIVAAAVVTGLVGIAIAATWLIRSPAADPCTSVADGVEAIWRPTDASRLAASFAATGRPNAADAASRVSELLDHRVAEWAELRIGTCIAERSDDRERSELHARQATCLTDQLHELDALVSSLLDKPTGEIVDRSIRVAMQLAPVSDCGRVDALLDRPARDPATALQIDQLDDAIAKARIRDALAGDVRGADELERRAQALHWEPAIAEAANLSGTIAYRRSDLPAAEAAQRRAALAAARAHDDAQVATAMAAAADAVTEAGRPHEGLEMARAAELACVRAGDPPALRAEVEGSLGDAYRALSQFDDSDRAYGAAVAVLEASNASPYQLAKMMNAWANQLFDRSDYARALPLSNKALVGLRAVLGDHHPDVARALQSNGNLWYEAQDLRLAKERFEEALAIKRAVFAPDDPTIAMTLHSLGNVEKASGHLAEARALYAHARDIWLARSGPASANVLMARYSLAVTLRREGKLADARAELADVLAIRLANADTPPSRIANTLGELAQVEGDLGHWDKAIEYSERALAIRDKALGPDAGDVAESLAVLAVFEAEQHACGKTREHAARAITILHKQPGGDSGEVMASVLDALASCAALDGKRDEAIADYRRGLAMLASPDQRGELDVPLAELLWPADPAAARAAAADGASGTGAWSDTAKAWLAAHPP